MALNDLLANPGTPFQSSFLRAEGERRAKQGFELQQMQRRQSIQQNDLQLKSMQREQETSIARTDAIRQYQGDKKGLVDALYNDGDLEGAANIVKFQTQLGRLDSGQRKEAEARMKVLQSDTLDTSGSIIEAFKRDDGGRSGMSLAIQEGRRMAQQYPALAQQLPDFSGMHPEEVKNWWENKYNRSYKNREFEQDKLQGGTGNSAFERARARALSKDALPEDISRFRTLSGIEGRAPVKGTKERFNERMNLKRDKFGFEQTKQKTKRTDKLRAGATKDMSVLKFMNGEIQRIKALIKVGDPLSTKQIRAGLANLSGARVRALADLKQYGTFGTLPERLGNAASLFFSGNFSDEAFRQASEFVTGLEENYVKPGMKEMKIYWRGQAKGENVNPHSVARYDNPQELLDDMRAGLLTREQARLIAADNKQWSLKKQ